MHNIKTNPASRRVYRKITPSVIAKFQAALIMYGSGTAAVRILEPDETDPRRRAWLISTKCKQLGGTDFLNFQLEQIGVDAINRLGELVHSEDERVATKSVIYVIDQVRGKALQRADNKHTKLTIESVLD